MACSPARILFGINLLLLALVSIACVASQFVGYSASVLVRGRGFTFDTVRGEISLWTAAITPPSSLKFRQMFYDARLSITTEEVFAGAANPVDQLWQAFGFGYARGTILYYGPPVANGAFARTIVVPYWFLIGALSVSPLRRTIARLEAERTRRRLSAGQCVACGYELRGSEMRCPSCGIAPESAPAGAAAVAQKLPIAFVSDNEQTAAQPKASDNKILSR